MERVRTLKILWRFWVADLRVLSSVIPSVLLFPLRLGTLLNRFPHFSSLLLTGSSCEVFNELLIQWYYCPRVSSNKSIFAFIWLQAVSGCLSLEEMCTEVLE